MEIPKLLEDLSVISKLGDNPGADNDLTAEGLKAKFDEAALKIQAYLNDTLIEMLNLFFSSEGVMQDGLNMIGPINMNNNRLKNLPNPIDSGDAVNLSFANKTFKKADWMPTAAQIGAASADSVGTSKVFKKLTDIGITTFPTTMKIVANAMPENSTLMLDSRDIISGGTHEISDLGIAKEGMYMIMRGNSTYRVSLLLAGGHSDAEVFYLRNGCYASNLNKVTWYTCVPDTRTINGKALSSNVTLSASDVGAARGGFGFDGKPVSINSERIYTEDELDTALEAVYSSMDTYNTKLVRILGYPAASDFNWFGILSRSSEKYGSLLAHSASSKGSLVLKTKSNGVWLPTEWVNPPMVSGTEYRTTERWNNKPVYAKLLVWKSTSSFVGVANASVPHGISDIDVSTARIEATTFFESYDVEGGVSSAWVFPFYSCYTDESLYVRKITDTEIKVRSEGTANWDSGRTFYFLMKYCKNT